MEWVATPRRGIKPNQNPSDLPQPPQLCDTLTELCHDVSGCHDKEEIPTTAIHIRCNSSYYISGIYLRMQVSLRLIKLGLPKIQLINPPHKFSIGRRFCRPWHYSTAPELGYPGAFTGYPSAFVKVRYQTNVRVDLIW